jgi:hypothetical protein
MDVARSLMAIFTAFERQFDSINTTARIGGGVRGEPAPVAYRPKPDYRYVSDDLTNLQGIESGYDIRTFLRVYLKGSLNRVQLQKFLDNELISHRNTVLDVSRVWDDSLIAYNHEYVSKYCMKKPTISFRLHAGSLDSNEQVAWMDLCGLLTEFSYLENLRHVNNWTRRCWIEPHNEYTILFILKHIEGYNNDTFAHYKKLSVPIKDLESTIEQPHILSITAEWEAEKVHTGPLKSTGVPRTILYNNARYKSAEYVWDKVRHKFDMGLYGRFPVETVAAFIRDHHEKCALLKKGWKDLVLHED